MNKIKILLAETPNAVKKDFLAIAEPISPFDQNEDLPLEITLDRYTREPWSRHSSTPQNDSCKWKGIWLKSTDKKGRLRGFLKFLKGRSKAAFGKFVSPHPDEVTGEDCTALFLVPFEQPPFPSKDILEKEDVSNVEDLIFVKYCFDEKELILQEQANKPQEQTLHMRKTKQQTQPVQQRPNVTTHKASALSSSKSRGGILGSILGAQEKTNRHLEAFPKKRKPDTSSSAVSLSNENDRDNRIEQEGRANIPVLSTSNQVLANFRTKIEKKLTAFESSSQTEIKIQISQAEESRALYSSDEKAKLTMDVLKYIVYEQTEEIGQDEWVAAKEPSEFMDEASIIIYKAGYAPEEVLEELNKGEMPDEARHQQRAMREALNREEKKKAKAHEEMNMKKAFQRNHEVKRLNNVKRDRRSIEEIQRDMMNDAKRSKL